MKYSETIDAGIQKTERNLNAEQADIEAREVRILSNASEREVAMGGMNKVKKYVAIGTIAAFGGFFAAKALSKEDPNPYGNSGIPERVTHAAEDHQLTEALQTAQSNGENPEKVITAPQ